MNLDFLHKPDFWFWSILIASVLTISIYIIKFRFNNNLLSIIRLILLLTLLIGLFQPKLTRIFQNNKQKVLKIFIDNSMSMGYHTNQSLTKINSEFQSLKTKLDKKNIQYFVQLFDKRIHSPGSQLKVNGKGVATNLGAIIKSAKSEDYDNLFAYLIITDGQNTIGLDPIQSLEYVPIPIFTLGIGNKSALVDLSIKSIDAPTVAIKNQDIEIVGTIESFGDINKRITISLFDEQRLIGSKFVNIHGNGTQSKIRFRINPNQLGKSLYTMKISSLEEELNIQNNKHSFSISILKDEYRIALLTGAPFYNTNILKQTIKKMDRVSLDYFIQDEIKFRPGLQDFWEKKYELIILDNFPATQMSKSWYSFLRKKIKSHNTSLAWIGGPAIEPELSSSMYSFFRSTKPTSKNNNILEWQMTTKGESVLKTFGLNPEFNLQDLTFPPLKQKINLSNADPWFYSLATYKNEFNDPVLLIGEKNDLRLACWTPENLYSLYYNLTGLKTEDFSEILFSSLFSWLLKTGGSETLHFRLDKNNYQQGEQIYISGIRYSETTMDANVKVNLMSNNKIQSSTVLQFNPIFNRWEGSLWASSSGENEFFVEYKDQTGIYEQSGNFIVEESQIELNNLFLNELLLTNISNKTNGKYYPLENMNELILDLNPDIFYSTETNRIYLFESWWIAFILITLLSIEWGIRRKFGFL